MGQRIVDASVLAFFALLYSCAVFMLRFRRQSRWDD
jgi:hypothetical protein